MELPDGSAEYTVNLLKGFVFRSWMDYLTFGRYGTGGWASPDGTINCIEQAYDLESERFRVSLLKHEAQHTVDRKRFPQITPAELEYRAKLVELHFLRATRGCCKSSCRKRTRANRTTVTRSPPQGSDESLQIRTKRCFRAFRRGRWSYSARIRGNWRKSTGKAGTTRTGKLYESGECRMDEWTRPLRTGLRDLRSPVDGAQRRADHAGHAPLPCLTHGP